VDLGNDKQIEPEPFEQHAEVAHAARFVSKVELLANLFLEAREVAHQLEGRLVSESRQPTEERHHEPEVGCDDLREARA
jgi:hypothetical protein